MINYSNSEEKEVLLHYAEQFDDGNAREVLNNETLKSESEAKAFAEFYWRIVDIAAERNTDEPANISNTESLVYTMTNFFSQQGYEDLWDQILDDI